MASDDKVNLWEVLASTPTGPEGRHPGYANLRHFVVAASAEQAMEMVRSVAPHCIFHKIERRNAIHTTGKLLVHPDTLIALHARDAP